jgi:hypothetical protein
VDKEVRVVKVDKEEQETRTMTICLTEYDEI